MRKKIVNAEIVSCGKKYPECGLTISQDGSIEEIFGMSRYASEPGVRTYDAGGALVSPGLIDTHIHGFGGFGTEDKSSASILGMSEELVKFGVTSFFPTLYPDFPDEFFKAQNAISEAMGHEKGSNILGMHLEGPFVSPRRCGALPSDSMSEPDISYLDKLIENGRGNVICMTVAPELAGMGELARHAIENGLVLLAGHTDAAFEEMLRGMEWGIRHSTHLFNAMSPLHHRKPGAVGAVLTQDDMSCEIIADGVHVDKELVKFLVRVKPADKIVLVTDSLKPTQQKSGRLFANGQEVVLGPKGGFVSVNNPNLLNGSSLSLNNAVANLVSWGISPEISIKAATENPAAVYNLKRRGSLLPGNIADIAVFEQDFKPRFVFVKGEQVV